MAKTKDFETIVLEKKATLDILERLMKELSSIEEYRLLEYVEDGEEQKKDWDGNLLYRDGEGNSTTEDTGNPIMKTKYKQVRKTDLDKEDEAYISSLELVRETLANLA